MEYESPATKLLDQLDEFLDRAIKQVKFERDQSLSHSLASDDPVFDLYQKRQELARLIGVVDPREPINALTFIASTKSPSCVARTDSYEILQIRWPVLEGVDGEGLWIRPVNDPVASVIAIPDADWTPIGICGVDSTVAANAQFARRLAELGCEVFVPVIIDRQCRWSGNPQVKMTNQPHREFIYRMAFQMGRHIIGYEVQKVLSLVDPRFLSLVR